MFDAFTVEPQVLVGSSMGGWLALLLAKRLGERGDGDRLHGMVLLAPAVDMTKDLMWDRFSPAKRRKLKKQGLSNRALRLFAGARHHHACADRGRRKASLRRAPDRDRLPGACHPGHAGRGRALAHATKLMERLAFDDAVLTLVRDGDHRLSRPEDIERLIGAVSA